MNPFRARVFLILFFVIVVSFLPGCAGVEKKEEPTKKPALQWPPPPMEPRIRYVRTISAPSDIVLREKRGWLGKAFDFITGGAREGEAISIPYGIYYDSEGELLYVADRGLKGVHRYDLKKGKAEFKEMAGEELFRMPVSLLVAEEKLYVSDTLLNKVLVFTLNGKLIDEIEGFGRPGGLAFDSKRKTVYVVDVLNSRVMAFDIGGNLMFAFGKTGGGDGEFNLPTNIWVDGEGKVYVTDSMNFRVQVFDEKGNHLRNIGKLGDAPGHFARPRGVAVDSDGNIYVADADFDNVQIFNQDGELLLHFGELGIKPGQFVLPSGIFIDGEDRIYIADSYNKRIQVFQYLKED